MITSYTVGAIFEIQAKEATATLERLGVAFAGLDEKITALQTKMGAIGKGEGLFTGLLTGIEAVGTAFGGLGVKASEAGDAIVRAMARGADAAKAAAAEINAAVDAAGRMGGTAFREGFSGSAPPGAAGTTGPSGSGLLPIPAYGSGSGQMARLSQDDFERVPPFGSQAPLYGYPRGRGEPQQRLGGPPGFGGWTGSGRAGPPGVGGSGFIPPRDESFDHRQTLNLNKGGSSGGAGWMLPGALGLGVYEAMKTAAEEEESIDQILNSFHIDPRAGSSKDIAKQRQDIRDQAQAGVDGTSFSRREALGAEVYLAKQLPTTLDGPKELAKFLKISQAALKTAEAGKRLKIGTIDETMGAVPGFMHMMGDFDPDKLEKDSDLLGNIAQLLKTTIGAEATSLGYIVPMARELGTDPVEGIIASAWLQRAGLKNTLGPTTLRQATVGQLKGGGPLGAKIESENSLLEHALKLDPGHLSGKAHPNLHKQALEDLNILDRKTGLPTDLFSLGDEAAGRGKAGGIDYIKMFDSWAKAAKEIPGYKFGNAMYHAYGIRGDQAGMIAQHLNEPGGLTEFRGMVKGGLPLAEQLRRLGTNPVQQTEQAAKRITDLGDAIGHTLLPQLAAFNTLVINLATSLRGTVEAHPEATGTVMRGGIMATIAFLLKGLGGGISAASKHFLGGPSLGGRVLSGLGSGLLVGAGLETAKELEGEAIDSAFNWWFGKERMDKGREEIKNFKPLGWISHGFGGDLLKGLMGSAQAPAVTARNGPRVGMGDGVVDRAEPGSPAPVTVNVTTHVSGVIDEHSWSAMLARLMESIKTAMQSATEGAHGSHVSPYISNGSL